MTLLKVNITTRIINELHAVHETIHSVNSLPNGSDDNEWQTVHDELLKGAKHLVKAYSAASEITLRGAGK
jgi:hypothetical protein